MGGVLVLAIPDMRYEFDAYRNKTVISDLVDAWIRNESIPTPKQIFDCLSNAFDTQIIEEVDTTIPLLERKRLYSDSEALMFSKHGYFNNEYLDMHCTAYTPESFKEVFEYIVRLNILKFSIIEIVEHTEEGEFIVAIRKEDCDKCEMLPKYSKCVNGLYDEEYINSLVSERNHAVNAFYEAVEIQNALQNQIEQLNEYINKYINKDNNTKKWKKILNILKG